MKKITKLATGICMASMILGTTVFASTQGFSFSLRPSQLDSTSNYSKADSEQRAYVTASGGNLASSDQVWFKVKNSANTVATEAKWINSYQRITLNYQSYASAGGAYHLNAQQDSSARTSVNVTGMWTP